MSDNKPTGPRGGDIQRDSEDIRLSLERAFGQGAARPPPLAPAADQASKTSNRGGHMDHGDVELARAAFRARIAGTLDENDL